MRLGNLEDERLHDRLVLFLVDFSLVRFRERPPERLHPRVVVFIAHRRALVGEAAVGKTSLIRRFVLENFDDKYIQTLGTKVSKKELTSSSPDGSGELKIDMTIWDIMGQKGFRELLKEAYFYGARGILAVC